MHTKYKITEICLATVFCSIKAAFYGIDNLSNTIHTLLFDISLFHHLQGPKKLLSMLERQNPRIENPNPNFFDL